MKNYLEHSEEVKYIDGLLANNQDWEWFVELIEKNYEIAEINDWNSFRTSSLNTVFFKFVKILQVYKGEFSTRNMILGEIVIIAKYYWGMISLNECKSAVQSNYAMLLLLMVWITRLENSVNADTFILDFRLFTARNVWEIIDISEIKIFENDIFEFVDTLEIDGFDQYRNCFKENITEKKYDVADGFFENYRNNMVSVNAFSYQDFKRPEIQSWQEEYILGMLRTIIRDGKIIPVISGHGIKEPNIDIWSVDVIENLKKHFSNEIADFVLDSVNYIRNGVKPCEEVLLKHCDLLVEYMEVEKNERKIVMSSSFEILSWAFKHKDMTLINGETRYIAFVKKIHAIDSQYILKAFYDCSFPISKEQRQQVKNMYAEQYKTIEKVKDINGFLDYLCNEDIPKQITTEYLQIVIAIFDKSIEEINNIQISTMFYQYMVFLIRANGKNADGHLVKNEMIRIQNLWQNKYYYQQRDLLETHIFKTTIAHKDLETFNDILEINPVLVAKQCVVVDEAGILRIMENASENAALYLFQTMLLSPNFPKPLDNVTYDRHEIDEAIRDMLQVVKEKNEYRFINELSVDKYMIALYQRFMHGVESIASFFVKEEELYNYIGDNIGYELIPFEKELKLAHLTQLFPALEICIRKLGSMIGVVPFKEKLEDFAKFKDSNSVLREIVLAVKNELGSFDNVPDLLFVYNCMYNGNSLNIRNDCLHGRDYLSEGRLRFAFKVTLISLYMVIYRIMGIEQNLND